MSGYPKVEEIAQLAHLELAGEDLERLSRDFGRILDYLKQLEEVADGATQPRFHALAEEQPATPMRPDEPAESLPADEAVDQSPVEPADGQFRVPRVIE